MLIAWRNLSSRMAWTTIVLIQAVEQPEKRLSCTFLVPLMENAFFRLSPVTIFSWHLFITKPAIESVSHHDVCELPKHSEQKEEIAQCTETAKAIMSWLKPACWWRRFTAVISEMEKRLLTPAHTTGSYRSGKKISTHGSVSLLGCWPEILLIFIQCADL